MWFGLKIITARCLGMPSLSRPTANCLIRESIWIWERLEDGLSASIHIGLCVGLAFGGNRYDRMLHLGMSSAGHGEVYMLGAGGEVRCRFHCAAVEILSMQQDQYTLE